MIADPILIVRGFCEAWATHDVDAVIAPLAETIVWENVPIGIVSGKAAVAQRLRRIFARATRFEWHVLDIALSASGHVLTERLDVIFVEGRRIDIRLMGIFGLEGDRIVLWRDYFDLESYKRDMAGVSW